jgi:RNA polymerase sigma factor (sigma-70 family)
MLEKSDIAGIITQIKDPVFNLSVKFLSDFAEAQDATQDILIKILKNYSSLKDKDKFFPWSMKIATNHLIDIKKENDKFKYLSFDIMEKDCCMELPQTDLPFNHQEKDMLMAELKIGCSGAMLMCLSKEDRIIYILSSMFNMNSTQGSELLEITPEAFRKKLSRTKNKLKNFMQNNCGLVNKNATCKCRNRIVHALENHRISKEDSVFTSKKYLSKEFDIKSFIDTMDKIEDYSEVFKSDPQYPLPEKIAEFITTTLE